MGLKNEIWTSRLGFRPLDWDFGLQTRIWAFKARIWAWRLGFGPRDLDLGLKTGGDRRMDTQRRRKLPICVKAWVIDPFRAAAQKGKKSYLFGSFLDCKKLSNNGQIIGNFLRVH